MKIFEPYTVSEPLPGLYAIDEGGVRSFLIPGEKEALLIDSGFGRGDLAAQIAEISPLPVKLVHTHTDGDHTGCDAQFSQIFLHPAEYDYWLRKSAGRGIDVGSFISRCSALWEGDILSFGEYKLEVVLIPGHTPGSIALLERGRRFLIGGDSVQNGAVFMFGEGRCMPAYLASMKKLESMRPLFDTVLASHSELTVEADIIPELIEGAQLYLEGKLEGVQPPRQMPCMLYKHKRGKFLC